MVTGASSGIGEATALGLAARGAHVVMVGRDALRCSEAAARIRAKAPDAKLSIELADLASLKSVGALVERLARLPSIDVLVLDAGVTTKVRESTEDGFEKILAVDFLVGSFALALPLIPRMPRGARIVQLAGIYHRRGHIDLEDLQLAKHPWTMSAANARAQLARVLFVVELAERVAARGIRVDAVHPGAVITNAQRDAPLWARVLIHTLARPGFVLPARGAAPVLRLCEDPDLGVSGRFFDRMREAPLPPAATDRALRAALWERAEQLTRVTLPAAP